MTANAMDDVICIRIDTDRAVRKFMDMLAEQAEQGETRAPANPANRAVFRELAPFRLVEFSYVDQSIGGITGVYFGFQDEAVFSVAEEIPEDLIDALVASGGQSLPPIYVYILLDQPVRLAKIDHFLRALARHVDEPLVGLFDHGRVARVYAAETGDSEAEDLTAGLIAAHRETSRHLGRVQVLGRYLQRIQGGDGRAWAVLTYQFQPRIFEFASGAQRDDFIAWTTTLDHRMQQGWSQWTDLGMDPLPRPAQIAPRPAGEIRAVSIIPPTSFDGGALWRIFEDKDAASPEACRIISDYWRHVAERLQVTSHG